MTDKLSVLFTGCSWNRHGYVSCIKHNPDNRETFTVGVDCNEMNLLNEDLDARYVIPRITHPDFIPSLIEISKRHGVQVIIPTLTIELDLLSANKRQFEDNGIIVSVDDPFQIRYANDKAMLSLMFGDYMPHQKRAIDSDDVAHFAEDIGYPEKKLCCKLEDRCGGFGFVVCDDEKAADIRNYNVRGKNTYVSLDTLKKLVDRYRDEVILSDYIEGNDYTVCILADKGKVLAYAGIIGYQMSYGTITSGQLLPHKQAYDIAFEIVERLGLSGNLCVDFMIDNDNKAWLLEVNPRVSGSLPILADCGLNLPYLRVKQLLREPVEPIPPIESGITFRKYYATELF